MLREPIERGKVWLLESGALAGRLLATVNFLPEAEEKDILNNLKFFLFEYVFVIVPIK